MGAALRLVLGVSLLRGLAGIAERGGDTALLPSGYGITAGYALDLPAGVNPALLAAGRIGVALVFGLLAWSARARMLPLATRVVTGQRVERGPFLRVVGYAAPPGLVGPIPVAGPVLSTLATTAATTLGLREIARTTTAKAVLIALLSLLFTILFTALIAAVVTVVVVLAMRGGV